MELLYLEDSLTEITYVQESKLKVANNKTPFTKNFEKGQVIDIPIAHAEGRFYTQDIDLMKDQDQIVLQFAEKNPNGSMEAITGVCDESGLVLAMMPHPERATTKLLGSDNGLEFFKGMLDSIYLNILNFLIHLKSIEKKFYKLIFKI